MNKDLEDKWKEAEETGQAVPVGRIVVCDNCSEDYTDQPHKGGFIFQSKAICPLCAPVWMKNVRRYGEEAFIRARARPDESFADFVRRVRGPDAAIRITTIKRV